MFAAINGTKIYFDVEGSGYIPLGPKMVKNRCLLQYMVVQVVITQILSRG